MDNGTARKNFIYATSLVAVGFFWFGSVFFSYLETLKAHFEPETAAAITVSLSYGAHTLGILLYVCISAKIKRLAESKLVMSLSFGLGAVGILGSFISPNDNVIIISGVLFNLFGTSGMLLGYQFLCITEKLPQRMYGRAFGFAYALGSAGTTLLALAFGGRCPVGYSAVMVYIPIILLNFIMILFKDKLTNEPAEATLPERAESLAPATGKLAGKTLIIMLVCVFFVMGILGAISGLMQHAYMDINNQINSAYIRVFYPIGLILAGFLIDYNRRMGAIAAIAANAFSFLLVLLIMTPGRGFEAVAFSYILAGFLNVFQVAASMDIAKKAQNLYYFSVFGFLFNRLGEVLATLPYNYIKFDLLRETMLASVFFVILLLLFFLLMKKLYDPVLPDPAFPVQDQTLGMLIASYGITERESETLRLLIAGKSTFEISEAMVITEKTVQKYISSMMEKTDSKSRSTMIAMFAKIKD